MRLADVVEVLEVDKQLEPRAAETRAGLEEGWRQSEYFWTQVPSLSRLVSQPVAHSLTVNMFCTRFVKVVTWICQSCCSDLLNSMIYDLK